MRGALRRTLVTASLALWSVATLMVVSMRRPHRGKMRTTAPGRLDERVCSKGGSTASPHEGPASDRGDVPGWVMITMMTAIVVIVLLGVFQEAVLNAVRDAFNSITAEG